MTRPPSVTYQQCGAPKQDPNGLACYDRVLRQISLQSAKDAHPMVSGEIPTEQPLRKELPVAMMIVGSRSSVRQVSARAPVEFAARGSGSLFMRPL
jgi:hypothetical protein